MASFEDAIAYKRLATHCRNQAECWNKLHGLPASRDIITGRLTLVQIYEGLVEALGLSLDYAAFERAWLEPYTTAMPGMAELVRALAPHYKLVLLSNVDCYYWAVIQAKHPVLMCFDHILLSCQLGIAKPDREIFLHASKVARMVPSQCYFIDDTLSNVEAARALGFETHWFKGVPELRNDLKLRKTRGIYER